MAHLKRLCLSNIHNADSTIKTMQVGQDVLLSLLNSFRWE